MTENPESARRKSIYVREEDQELWEIAGVLAELFEEPLSVVIAAALREYRPVVAWRAAHAAAKDAARAAKAASRAHADKAAA